MSVSTSKSSKGGFGPPRPCAIATVVDLDDEFESDIDFDSDSINKQKKNEEFKMASLYSLVANTKNALMQEQKKSASIPSTQDYSYSYPYPPEIVIITTKFESESESNLQSSKSTSEQRRRRERRERVALACRCMSTRLVEFSPFSLSQADNTRSHTSHSSTNKMAMIATLFRQSVYQSIAYIDCQRCLVRKDISHLFSDYACDENPSSATQQASSLISALPKSSNSFDTSVMLLRPSFQTYHDLITIIKRDTSSNVSTTSSTETSNDFVETTINEYFQTTWANIPIHRRLGMQYNYHLSKDTTTNNNSINNNNHHDPHNFNNVCIYNNDVNNNNNTTHVILQQFKTLCQKLYNKSISYIENYQMEQQLKHKAKLEAQERTHKKLHLQHTNNNNATNSPNNNQITKQNQIQKHRLVSKRYKQLRKQGKDPKQAMAIARKEHGMDEDDKKSPSPSSQVASMFGMGGMI